MKEAALVRKILAWLKEQPETWAFKVHGSPMQVAGVPDILGCSEGRFFGLEVKTPEGRTTLLQEAVLRKIEGAGGLARVVRSLEEAEGVLTAARRTGGRGERSRT